MKHNDGPAFYRGVNSDKEIFHVSQIGCRGTFKLLSVYKFIMQRCGLKNG